MAHQPLNLTYSQYQLEQARAKLIAYELKFVDELGTPSPDADYAREFIFSPTANAIGIDRVEMPVPLTDIELEEWKGFHIFRENSTKFITLTKRPYHTGLKETIRRMAAVDWTGFNTAPEVIAEVIKAWTSKNSVMLLNATPDDVATNDYTDTPWWSTTAVKPENPLRAGSRTYLNFYPATTLTQDNILTMIANLADRRDFNDNSRGLMVTHAYSSTALYPTLIKTLTQERLPTNETNPLLAYNIRPVHWPDLSPSRWGIFAWRPQLPFWGALEDPPRYKILMEGSALWEKEDSFGINVIVDLGVGRLRPETIIGASTT